MRKRITPFLHQSVKEQAKCIRRYPRTSIKTAASRKIKLSSREKMASPRFDVDSPKVQFNAQKNSLLATYDYQTTKITETANGKLRATPFTESLTFKTNCKVPRVGCMLVGWGGNNGSTLTASVMANKKRLEWRTKEGVKKSNYLGSLTQASTSSLGIGPDGKDVYIPFKDLLPMVEPNDIEFDGWDISARNLAAACEDARVLDISIQDQLRPFLSKLKPRPSIYCPDFIAANQEDRADNVLKGTKQKMMDQIRADIRDFKSKKNLDKVIVLWTANTERYCDVAAGLNDTTESLLNSISTNQEEVSPSTIFAVASILEGCTYINGSPQNTFVPGVVELAEKKKVFLAGDDFKSGQTKVKSVLTDFLVSAGIKPVSIVSYNHLGNNDGKNLSAPKQFRSKEISKSNVVDDMVESNAILYAPGEKPDHTVVIKYVPYVGDSKRAMDEYTSEIFMGGHNTVVLHNTCEDSLLAAPIILDLVILAELCERIVVKKEEGRFERFHPVLSILSYLLKAPMVPKGSPVINALFRQRACIENIFRACSGLPPVNHMLLEHKLPQLMTSKQDHVTQEECVSKSKQPKVTGILNGNTPLLVNGTNGYRSTNGHL